MSLYTSCQDFTVNKRSESLFLSLFLSLFVEAAYLFNIYLFVYLSFYLYSILLTVFYLRMLYYISFWTRLTSFLKYFRNLHPAWALPAAGSGCALRQNAVGCRLPQAFSSTSGSTRSHHEKNVYIYIIARKPCYFVLPSQKSSCLSHQTWTGQIPRFHFLRNKICQDYPASLPCAIVCAPKHVWTLVSVNVAEGCIPINQYIYIIYKLYTYINYIMVASKMPNYKLSHSERGRRIWLPVQAAKILRTFQHFEFGKIHWASISNQACDCSFQTVLWYHACHNYWQSGLLLWTQH